MKKSHIAASVAFDRAAADVTGVYTGFLDAGRIERVLKAAKEAGHSAVRVMLDNDVIREIDAAGGDRLQLLALDFVVGVDVPASTVVAAVNAWSGHYERAPDIEIDLA